MVSLLSDLRSRCFAAVLVAGLLGALPSARGHGQGAPDVAAVVPGAEWERVTDVRAAGYCQDRLDTVTARATTLATTSMVVVVGGRVLWDYGDLASVSYLASVRKSILAMMFGKYVSSGAIRLDATMADLKIDDVQGLTDAEKTATVADLLAARSGVYHPAANAACTGCGSTMGEAPPRGSVKPGTYFLYNNWDFNALGTIFEQQTGLNIYDAFEKDLAMPMALQDFTRAAQRKTANARASMHPAYHFNLSTRDMARIGLLMLRKGEWGSRALLSKEWTARITAPVTRVADMHPDELRSGPFGYGYLWWVWDGPGVKDAYVGAYTGQGAVGQFITVIPALDMVVAHKTRPGQRGPDGRDRAVSGSEYRGLLDAVIAARCGRQAVLNR